MSSTDPPQDEEAAVKVVSEFVDDLINSVVEYHEVNLMIIYIFTQAFLHTALYNKIIKMLLLL